MEEEGWLAINKIIETCPCKCWWEETLCVRVVVAIEENR